MSHDAQPILTTEASVPPPQPRRARGLIALTALLMLAQIGAAARALQISPELAAQISLPLPLEVAASGLWAGFAAFVLAQLWWRKRRARLYAAWLAVGFSIYSLLRLLSFSRADYDQARFPFLVVLVALLLIAPAFYIARAGRVARKPDGVITDGRKSKN